MTVVVEGTCALCGREGTVRHSGARWLCSRCWNEIFEEDNMTIAEQRDLALVRANEKRHRMSNLRTKLCTEEGALAAVLLDPPPELAHMPVIDVVRLAWGHKASRSFERLGRLAVRDGVNLMMPLGVSSRRTREWLSLHATWNWCAGRSRRCMVEERLS